MSEAHSNDSTLKQALEGVENPDHLAKTAQDEFPSLSSPS